MRTRAIIAAFANLQQPGRMPPDRPAVADVIGAGTRSHTRWRLLAAVVLLVLVGLFFWRSAAEPARTGYQTQAVRRGELLASVTATGTLQPVNQVDIGSELSGTVSRVEVDDNDRVVRGQLLAELDVSRLQDQAARSQAAVVAARARVQQADAGLREADLLLKRSRALRERAQPLLAQADLDLAQAAFDRATATRSGADADVAQAEAVLRSDLTNLDKAQIRSPIDGVILSRQVMPGQTVAASLQAPVLFIVAENLGEMKLEVDVSEADVGQVEDGQSATFRVDAWPRREYQAQVLRVGLGSQVKDNVVSYLTVLGVSNPDLSLRPGMTATAQIATLRREDALLVANAALRFVPPAAPSPSGSLLSQLTPRMPRPTGQRQVTGRSDERSVYVLRDGEPVAVPVGIGASDGRMTEITGGELREGDEVITGVTSGGR